MTREERLHKAADAYRRFGQDGDLRTRSLNPAHLRAILDAAFPELADGSHWLAPMELDSVSALRAATAYREYMEEADPSGASKSEALRAAFSAVRDALSTPQQAGDMGA